MSRSKYSWGELSSYLLETMDAAERRDLERRIFEDDDLALDLFDAEEELIERYYAGTLDAGTKDLFEKIYVKKDSQNEVLQLYRMLSTKRPSPAIDSSILARASSRLLLVSLSSLLIVVCGLVGFLMNHKYKLENELRESRLEANSLSQKLRLRSQTIKNSADLPAVSTGTVQMAFLSPRVLRENADSPNSIEVRSTTDFLVLKLELENTSHGPYEVKLRSVDAHLIYSSGPISSTSENGRSILSFPLPVSQIQPGDYLIELIQTGSAHVEPAAEYYFRLRKK